MMSLSDVILPWHEIQFVQELFWSKIELEIVLPHVGYQYQGIRWFNQNYPVAAELWL